MFSHLSLGPSSADSQTRPPFRESVGEKLFGNKGNLLDDMMAESEHGAEAAQTRLASPGDVSTGRSRDEMASGQSKKMDSAQGKVPGQIRAFDPVTETGLITAKGKSIKGAIHFDTEGMAVELLKILKRGERGVEVLFIVQTRKGEWMATDVEEVSNSPP